MHNQSLDKVLVLLVDYNTVSLIPEVLKNISEDESKVTILIVDNGSTKETSKELKGVHDPRVHFVRLEENVGFVRGNNFGLEYALKNLGDFKYVFLLNTDAYCSPNLISGLKNLLEANPQAACISPKIFDRDGGIWYGGANFDLKKGLVSQRIKTDNEQPKAVYKVEVFSGCAVLFRTERFLEAGMLNEKLFMYFEEAECSMKIRKLGYDILYTPSLTVLHDVSFTSRNSSYLKTYYMTRNKFLLFNGTMTRRAKAYYLAHEFAYNIKNKKYKNALYLLKGYLDFRKGKIGPMRSAA